MLAAASLEELDVGGGELIVPLRDLHGRRLHARLELAGVRRALGGVIAQPVDHAVEAHGEESDFVARARANVRREVAAFDASHRDQERVDRLVHEPAEEEIRRDRDEEHDERHRGDREPVESFGERALRHVDSNEHGSDGPLLIPEDRGFQDGDRRGGPYARAPVDGRFLRHERRPRQQGRYLLPPQGVCLSRRRRDARGVERSSRTHEIVELYERQPRGSSAAEAVDETLGLLGAQWPGGRTDDFRELPGERLRLVLVLFADVLLFELASSLVVEKPDRREDGDHDCRHDEGRFDV
jgi:hypothetical protein